MLEGGTSTSTVLQISTVSASQLSDGGKSRHLRQVPCFHVLGTTGSHVIRMDHVRGERRDIAAVENAELDRVDELVDIGPSQGCSSVILVRDRELDRGK